MAQRDYYEVLGVPRNASANDLKSAYRKLAKKHHPDANPGNADAENNFKEINNAYEILKDDQSRAAYDQFGHAAFENGGRGGGNAGGAHASGFGNFDSMDDVFNAFFGGGTRRGRAQRQRRPQRGNDLRGNISITLEEAFNGLSRKLNIKRTVACTKCKGSGAASGVRPSTCETCNGHGMVRTKQGFFTVERPCPTCHGTGQVITNPCDVCRGQGVVEGSRTLSVDIPAGIEDGTRIRLTGEGNAGPKGAPSGDFYVFVNVTPHPFLQRDGADLFCKIPVRFTQAALGDSIDVPLLDGKRVKVSLPKGTQTGQQCRVRGKGMPVIRSRNYGDLYVQFEVETPASLTSAQAKLLREFDTASNDKSFPKVAEFEKTISRTSHKK